MPDGVDELVGRDAVRKLFAGDGSLFSDDPERAAEIGRWTGWIPVVGEMRREADAIQLWAAEAMRDADRVVLCGMGGSSLAPLVLGEAFGGRLHVLDTTDPDAVLAVPVAGSLFVIASKSGSTLEPEVMEEYFFNATGHDGSRFVAITDPGSKLAARAAERGFRRTFLNRADIGGRFSALSYFGLVPAALAGIEIAPILDRAVAVLGRSGPGAGPADNAPLKLGALLGDSVRQGRNKLTIIADPAVGPFGLWLEQLIAESTGKEGTGVVPLADEPIGPPGVYGSDRLFTYLRVDGSHDAAVAAIEGSGFHVERCQLADLNDIGAQMITWELATAYCGALLHINPFDQPNVQAAKDKTAEVLAAGEPNLEPEGSVDELLALAQVGDYVCIQAFVDPARVAELEPLQARAHETGCVVTTGLGPRYLHSTGQLHKGGPNTGLFIQVVDETGDELPIPGREFGFGRLIRAQAAGDYASLKERGRRVARIRLEGL